MARLSVRDPMTGAVIATLGLLALRLDVARSVGFGDAEALYASYALHPQPAYLDHPGLIGTIARTIGGGGAPDPFVAHLATAILASLLPWLGALAAWAAGATRKAAITTVLALALVPELSVGLFALTPHLPLAFAWIGALGCGALALRSPPESFRALAATLAAGALVGVACLSHASGVLLGLSLIAGFIGKNQLLRWKTAGPWGALAIGVVLALPVLAWELREGWPMLQHRLIATQSRAGLSLTNLGRLLGGQLVYVTPPFLVAGAFVLRELGRARSDDPAARLLWLAVLVPSAFLIPLCLWSRVAEPQWLAPCLLALALYAGRAAIGRWLALGCAAFGAVAMLAVWALVRTPLLVQVAGSHYDPRYDLVNDLYAWQTGGPLLEQAVQSAFVETHRLPVVVGPHWTVCAQAHAVLGHRVPVGCNTEIRDDFDRWFARKRWLNAPVVLYVHDSRRLLQPELELPGRVATRTSSVEIRRGGRVVRTIWVTRLEKAVEIGAR